MTENQAEQAFVQRVRDAAEQYWLMGNWEIDQTFEKEGWSTYYAVDADVFSTYGSVEITARRTETRPGYSEVFSDDPPSGSYALAERLVDHIFFGLQPNSPLLVIPPIDREIRNILGALTARLGREPSPAEVDVDRIRAAIAEISDINETDPIPPAILDRFATLIALRGSDPRTEYRRLTNLLLLRRLAPSHSIENYDNYSSELLSALKLKDDISDIYHHAALSNKWIEKLYTKSSGRLSSYREQNLIHDAYCLARLELWNRKLEDSKIRILYVTGATHIINAASEYELDGTTFFAKAIRHPRHFLASPQVVVREDSGQDSEQGSSSQFFEWIVTFLADCKLDKPNHYGSMGTFKIDEKLERAAKEAFGRDSNLGADLRTKWRIYLEQISSSYRAPAQILEQIKKDLRRPEEARALDDWRILRDRLDGRIEEEIDKAWDACFRTATRAGYFVGYAADVSRGTTPSRLVPPLRFDRWPATEDFVRFMSEWRNPHANIVAEYEARLELVKMETKGDFDYAYYLAHAALFAARGDWRVGAILAIRAISKASHPEPDDGSSGHGREASYLAAYCLRHKAQTDADLQEADAYIDRAITIYQKELVRKPDLSALPERFESEKLALSMTKLLRRRYSLSTTISEEIDVSPEQLRDEFMKLSSRLVAVERELANKGIRIRDCLVRLNARVDANILMLSILMEDFSSDSFLNAGERLNTFLSAAAGNKSYYLEAVDLFWRVAVSRRRPSRSEVRSLFNDARYSSHSIFPYDRSRYKEMSVKLGRLMNSKTKF